MNKAILGMMMIRITITAASITRRLRKERNKNEMKIIKQLQ